MNSSPAVETPVPAIETKDLSIQFGGHIAVDMLNLTEHFLLQKELHSTIIYYSDIILKMILIPSTVWRVGKPNVAIRKASVVCIIKLLE